VVLWHLCPPLSTDIDLNGKHAPLETFVRRLGSYMLPKLMRDDQDLDVEVRTSAAAALTPIREVRVDQRHRCQSLNDGINMYAVLAEH